MESELRQYLDRLTNEELESFLNYLEVYNNELTSEGEEDV